jgi:putative nucleotidyltransferase with HDIG domain
VEPTADAWLLILSGPRAGERIPLTQRVTVGRSARCDVMLGGKLVSRLHAEIDRRSDSWVVRDLGSSNGTFVNGQLITQTVLRDGDRLGFSDVHARFGAATQGQRTGPQLVEGLSSSGERSMTQMFGQTVALQDALRSEDSARARRAASRLQAVDMVTQRLAQLADLETVQQRILDEVMAVVGAQRGALLRPGDRGFEVVGSAGETGQSGRMAVSRWVVEEVARRRVGILSDDVLDDPQITPSESLLQQGVRSVLAVPLVHDESLFGVLYLDSPGREAAFHDEDLHFVSAVAGVAAVSIANARALTEVRSGARKLNQAYLATISVLANAIEARDRYTIGHTWRVARIAQVIARRLGWSDERLAEVEVGGMLHDIGKIGVSDAILRKPSELSDDEEEQMRLHPQIGAHMLRDVPSLEGVVPYVLYHQERWDGTGYPFGLRGEEIPVEARLISVADALDAMISSRPYRPGMECEEAMAELCQQAGSQHDPAIVAALVGAWQDGALRPYLQLGLEDRESVICPFCSSCCVPSEGDRDAGVMECATCSRRLELRTVAGRISARVV